MAAVNTFKLLAEAVTAEHVQQIDAIYRFEIKTSDGVRCWLADLKNGSGSIKEVTGTEEKGDCTVIMTEKDFVALMKGDLDGQSAFMGGQLKIKGDMMLAMKLETLTEAMPENIRSSL